MHRLTKLGLCASLLLGTTVVLRAADEPAKPTQQEKKDAKREAKAEAKELKLVEPWKNISTLSAEQKSKIDAIHQKALDDISEIRAHERVEILALLSDEQKAELKAYQDKRATERKLKGGKDAPEGETSAEEPAAKAGDEKAGM